MRLGIAFTNLLLIPWNSRILGTLGCSRLIRCLRTKKHVANTADIASSDMKDIAIIDHAEFSKVGIIHNSISVRPAYFFSVSPEALETNTACIWMPLEVPATAKFFYIFKMLGYLLKRNVSRSEVRFVLRFHLNNSLN